MARSIEIHPAAVEDAVAAMAWYAARSSRAADGFLAELDLACWRIAESPERYPTHVSGTRRYLMRMFPFQIVYRVSSVYRRPGYWKERSG